MQFRNDINGLRALAVLPVLFFHAGLSGFSGGFLGVDVFFVISGFLITSNIIKSQSNGAFSIVSFYGKRARRILPPLILTLLVTLILSFIFMLPYDLKNLGQSLVATSFGANNILLYLTSGYWSLAAEFKPLYHTWSLGVEEQYYIIIPIVFIIFFNKPKVLLASVITLFLISILSSYIIENKAIRYALWQQAEQDEGITFYTQEPITNLAMGDSEVFATFTTQMPITAKLVVGADGANSWLRAKSSTASVASNPSISTPLIAIATP